MLQRSTIVSLLATLLLVGCSQSSGDEMPEPTPQPDQPQAITFGTAEDVKGRASTLIGATDQAEFRSQPLAVYGDWIYNEAGDRREVFHNVEVSYNGTPPSPSGWNYSPVKYWQPGGRYEFRAYWPAAAPVLGTATARTLALEYSMLTRNEDLMVAYTECPTGNNGQPVPLQFHHTLAAVAVKFCSVDSECEYRLKNLFFTSLNYIGALPFDSTDQEPDVTHDWVYTEGSRSYVDPTNIFNSERLREWSSTEGRVIPASIDDYPEEFDLFLPQSLVVGAGIAKPSITFTVDVIWGTTDTITMTIELPTTDSSGNEMVWRAGRKYIYLITVQPDRFDIEVRTTEWDEVNGSVGDIVIQ
ncbi:MAG: fimbrillin family protein [Alistipes sp.]|nr:fimbrillin family protein [Alistipes sp.]